MLSYSLVNYVSARHYVKGYDNNTALLFYENHARI